MTIIIPEFPKYQEDIIYSDARNTICEASTKVGKTFSHMWWLWELAHKSKKRGAKYWWVAPVLKQAKIAFDRMKRPIEGLKMYSINNSDLTITTPVGSIIEFKSGEIPDNLYGDDVHAVVLDEFTRMREEAWFAIRSTLTATNGPVKMIGNIKGTMNWGYQFARKVEGGMIPNWKHFKVTADAAVQAGIVTAGEVEQAKLELPTGVFLELYYGIPFVNSSNKFAYAFDKTQAVSKCAVDLKYPVYLSFDFNRNPISCCIIQFYEGCIHIPWVIKLENSNIYNLCTYIKNKFPSAHFIVNGDASGRASSAMVKDNMNYFHIIKSELGLTRGQMQQLSVNPRIEENQVLVNAVLEHIPHRIDPDNSQPLIFDLEFAEMLPDGTLKKGDRNDPAQQLDALDGYRYYINRNHRGFYKGYK